MKYRILTISFAILMIATVGIWQWHRHSPEHLASDPILAFEFFDLSDYSDHLVDAMYNEGDDCLSFGTAGYSYGNFTKNDLEYLIENFNELGAVAQDSTLILEKRSGNINGTATLRLNDNNNLLTLYYEKYK